MALGDSLTVQGQGTLYPYSFELYRKLTPLFSGPIPEPSSSLLLIAGALMAFTRRFTGR